ncbi:hypothetical protein Bca52824_021954 [Brassica carinata]|uniref:Uncharacterized protein n=1 Tax=Brassica carinata TaxID=52824 RepID=A0A8X7VFH6_BRACI|nr:hypothetical protein Bca52824_021954 [Brassica carinata]
MVRPGFTDGIPRRCDYVGKSLTRSGKEDYDSHPRKRYFTCINYEDDGMHYSHPWVVGVQEKIERLRKRLDDAEEEFMGKHVRSLTVQVGTLEKVRFD